MHIVYFIGLLQTQYPYEYRISADIASFLTVIGNALRCPAHIYSSKDIRKQLFPCLPFKPKLLKLFSSISSNRSLIPEKVTTIRRMSERVENAPWISVLLLNNDENDIESTSCIRKNGLQAIFEKDNIRRYSNIGIC